MRLALGFILALTLFISSPAFAQETAQGKCLDSTVMFYNCMKGTEIQKNLSTTYLLGSIQSLIALDLLELPKTKSMLHYRFEYMDYVETHPSIHEEPPGRGVVMYLLETYGKRDNAAGLKYLRDRNLIK